MNPRLILLKHLKNSLPIRKEFLFYYFEYFLRLEAAITTKIADNNVSSAYDNT